MIDLTDTDTTPGNLGGGLALVTDGGDESLVRMWGDVDATLRDQASEVMSAVIQRGDRVVVDASEVEFIDSSGLAFILQLVNVSDEAGRPVVLRDPPALVLEMFDMLGLSEHVPLDFSRGDETGAADEALEAARR